jgi:glycosyltransferase involved in cell wall biosynthesis
MTISVVIPTYNRRSHVFRAIDSALAQTVPVDEIIVVDDGSTDGTAEAVGCRYGSRVNVFKQDNGGAAAARNYGIREARGEWVAFLDSDDVWLPTKIERQVEALAALGREFGLCSTDTVFDGNPDMTLSRFQETGFAAAPGFGALEEPARYIVGWRNPFVTSSLVVRCSLLRDVGGFDEALVIGEDQDLMLRLGFRARVCFVAEQLVRMDRDPARTIGLERLLSTRSDRNYDSFELMYSKWLTMPEVAGTEYEQAIRELLRLVYYSSIEAKLHDLRMRPALGRIGQLRALGEHYPLIALRLFARKVKKLRHSPKGSQAHIG